LRALRFAAVLDFDIHPDTAQAVHALKSLLSHIAAERIREEFCKLLCGKGAVRILREYRDVIAVFLPDLNANDGTNSDASTKVYENFLRALSQNEHADLTVRLAMLLRTLSDSTPAGAERVMKALRFDNATVTAVTELLTFYEYPLSSAERQVKRLMRQISRAQILRLLELRRCDRLASAPSDTSFLAELEKIPAVMDALLASGACLSLKALAVKGDDLLSVGVKAGKDIGSILEQLLELVMDGTLPNEKSALLAEVKKHLKQS
jgi:tRNA nucleotidyltransferase (CCA-adding enzyme)